MQLTFSGTVLEKLERTAKGGKLHFKAELTATVAKAMKWVTETFAPLERASDSFMAPRLISRSRADTVRTLVAVGTARLAFMFATMRAAAPFSGVASVSNATTALAAGAGAAEATLGTVERW